MDGDATIASTGPSPWTCLADLQAGLLDDRTAAAFGIGPAPTGRRPIGSRRSTACAATSPISAPMPRPRPDIPADVTARVGAALRQPSRARLWGRLAPSRRAAAFGRGRRGRCGRGRRDDAPARRRSARSVAASRRSRPAAFRCRTRRSSRCSRDPLTWAPLRIPARRASCLSGLGYPTDHRCSAPDRSTSHGRPGVLLLLPDDAPGASRGRGRARTAAPPTPMLLASTVVDHP